MAEGAIPEDMLAKIIAKIKDPKSRKILGEYLEQEKAQETTAKTVVKLEEAEGKNEDYQDIIDKKNELVGKIKLAIDDVDLQKILTDNKVDDFKKELGEAGLKYSVAGLTKTINATKKKLETNRLVAQARSQMATQQPAQQPSTRARKQPPPAPTPPPPNTLITKLINPPVQPPAQPPVQPPVQPPAKNYAANHLELLKRLEDTRATKATQLKSVAELDKFLIDNGYDTLYKNGSASIKTAITKAVNAFVKLHKLT